MVRHLYESFRVQTFSSSLHYSVSLVHLIPPKIFLKFHPFKHPHGKFFLGIFCILRVHNSHIGSHMLFIYSGASSVICCEYIRLAAVCLSNKYLCLELTNASFFPDDRGLCFPTLAIWVLCIAFEYSFRYKFDHPTWYLARGPWFTAGLFPSTSGIPYTYRNWQLRISFCFRWSFSNLNRASPTSFRGVPAIRCTLFGLSNSDFGVPRQVAV